MGWLWDEILGPSLKAMGANGKWERVGNIDHPSNGIRYDVDGFNVVIRDSQSTGMSVDIYGKGLKVKHADNIPKIIKK